MSEFCAKTFSRFFSAIFSTLFLPVYCQNDNSLPALDFLYTNEPVIPLSKGSVEDIDRVFVFGLEEVPFCPIGR